MRHELAVRTIQKDTTPPHLKELVEAQHDDEDDDRPQGRGGLHDRSLRAVVMVVVVGVRRAAAHEHEVAEREAAPVRSVLLRRLPGVRVASAEAVLVRAGRRAEVEADDERVEHDRELQQARDEHAAAHRAGRQRRALLRGGEGREHPRVGVRVRVRRLHGAVGGARVLGGGLRVAVVGVGVGVAAGPVVGVASACSSRRLAGGGEGDEVLVGVHWVLRGGGLDVSDVDGAGGAVALGPGVPAAGHSAT